MLQTRNGPRFDQETLAGCRAAALGREELHGDRTTQDGVERLVDLAGGTAAKWANDLEFVDSGRGRSGGYRG